MFDETPGDNLRHRFVGVADALAAGITRRGGKVFRIGGRELLADRSLPNDSLNAGTNEEQNFGHGRGRERSSRRQVTRPISSAKSSVCVDALLIELSSL
jgi:hypothetical protein